MIEVVVMGIFIILDVGNGHFLRSNDVTLCIGISQEHNTSLAVEEANELLDRHVA